MHYVDAYGDVIAVEWFEAEAGRVDAYGDPEPVEQWEEDCEDDGTGHCARCREAIPTSTRAAIEEGAR